MSNLCHKFILILCLISIISVVSIESKAISVRGGSFKTSNRGGEVAKGSWFRSSTKSTGWGVTQKWPIGSRSINYGGKATRVVPVSRFSSSGSTFYYPYYAYYPLYTHHSHYDRVFYDGVLKEEDGFYPCSSEVVKLHQEALNKSLAEVVANGTLYSLFPELNSTEEWHQNELNEWPLNGTNEWPLNGTNEWPLNGTEIWPDGLNSTEWNSDDWNATEWKPFNLATAMNGSIESLVESIRESMANHTYMCYDEEEYYSDWEIFLIELVALIFSIIAFVILVIAGTWCYIKCADFYDDLKEERRKRKEEEREQMEEQGEPIPVKFYHRVTSGALVPIPMINPLSESSIFYGYLQSFSSFLQSFLATFIPVSTSNQSVSDQHQNVRYTPVHT